MTCLQLMAELALIFVTVCTQVFLIGEACVNLPFKIVQGTVVNLCRDLGFILKTLKSHAIMSLYGNYLWPLFMLISMCVFFVVVRLFAKKCACLRNCHLESEEMNRMKDQDHRDTW